MKCPICHLVAASRIALAFVAVASVAAAQDVAGVQILGRGPIHEAFAEALTFDPQPGVVAPRKPPEPIEEVPPKVRPEGTRVQWIPGYWTWDEERNDFIWVSGGWRNAPPKRRWMPGYWAEVAMGYQWISGFWAPESGEHIEYLPTPPASVEQGPTSAAPSPDHFWVPGSWLWRSATYVWRPGYWWQMTPGWIWIPATYRYTPRGVVFVGGYWDYELVRRGHLYAPVYYQQPIYVRPDYYYRPTSLVELGLLTASLFVHPKHHHYYFGDYYAPHYLDYGYYPWYGYGTSYRGFDPLFAYYQWHHHDHKKDRDWRKRIVREYDNRRDHVEARPPRVISPRAATSKPSPAAATEPLVRQLDDASIKRAAERVVPGTSEVARESADQTRRLRRARREAEKAEKTEVKTRPAVAQPTEQPRTADPLAVPERRAVQTPTKTERPRAKTPQADPNIEIPRWRVPERAGAKPAKPTAAVRQQPRAPQHPQPPTVKPSGAEPKSGPKTRSQNDKPKKKG